MTTRRTFMRAGAMAGAGLLLPWNKFIQKARADAPGGFLDPTTIPKFAEKLIQPPAMPISRTIRSRRIEIDYYEIAMRQFQQQILPTGMNQTTVWSYGSLEAPGTVAEGGSFNYPAFTIEARYNRPVRVKWINDLIDPATGNYLPHLLPVDQTLHWANPAGPRDRHGTSQDPYPGPVPMITHVHGAHTSQDFDGYPEAWYLPDANNIPNGFYRTGTYYDKYKKLSFLGKQWRDGNAVFQYQNDQRATTLWYHDHSLGMTRLNVYAGPAGFYLIRGGPEAADLDLGFVAPGVGDGPFDHFTEIPIAIQDRSFNGDGSLFYPDNRAFFENLDVGQLDIPFTPDPGCDGSPSDVAPIWNPEFFGDSMVVNGRTWPYLEVEPRTYRLRLLNGCNSRFLILKMEKDSDKTPVPFHQIGAEGGFLDMAPVSTGQILMSPAERADVIVDFSNCKGETITMLNLGPDEPFGGFPVDDPANPDTTGLVMQFRVGSVAADTAPIPAVLPSVPAPVPAPARRLSLNEEESGNVYIEDDEGTVLYTGVCGGEPFGPTAALLGTYNPYTGLPDTDFWMDPITENPGLGATETWEFYNFTADAHPIHIHQVQFQVVNREALDNLNEDGQALTPAVPAGNPRDPEPTESGFKDTVIAYPGEVTRVQAKFDIPGLFVWHCHIVEHEDNEMMRPFKVG